MSNTVTTLCRPLQLTPSQKAVLMCLADYCHDDGSDWHSLAAIMAWTCLGRTTVIDAMKALETQGLIALARSPGKKHSTLLVLDRIREAAESTGNPSDIRTGEPVSTRPDAVPHPSGSRTGPAAVPVRDPDHTRPDAVPPPVRQPDAPVRQPYPKHQEASVKASVSNREARRARKASPAKPRALEVLPEWVPADAWTGFSEMRRSIKKPMTETAARLMLLKLAKLRDGGHDPRAVLEKSTILNWAGIYPLKPAERAAAATGARASFKDMDYSAGVTTETAHRRVPADQPSTTEEIDGFQHVDR